MGRQAVRALNLVVSTQQEGQTRLQGRLGSGMQGSGACWPGFQQLGARPSGQRIGAPQGQRIGGYGSSLPPGLRARPTRGLGPFPHKNHPNLSNYDFSQTPSRLKWLLRRWGPAGKRGPPAQPPPPPPAVMPPSATIQHAPQGWRI